jgi:hypothetical protein
MARAPTDKATLLRTTLSGEDFSKNNPDSDNAKAERVHGFNPSGG